MNLPAAHPKQTRRAEAGTREALMDAAEELMAVHGVAGASVRAIIKAAGANLGAITYHFGTKDRLVAEVFARRVRPLDQERIARLDALEKAAGTGKLKLEQIMDALIRPMVEAQDRDPKSTTTLRLISRGFQEVNPVVKALIEDELVELAKRFDTAILRAAPGLPPEELFWRITFCFGALHHGLEAWSRFEGMPHPSSSARRTRLDREGFIQRIVAYVSAGIAASAQSFSSPSSTGVAPRAARPHKNS